MLKATERHGPAQVVKARVVSGTLGVRRGKNGWSITQPSTGYSAVMPVSRKVDAEKIARTLAVIDPGLYGTEGVVATLEAGAQKVLVEGR